MPSLVKDGKSGQRINRARLEKLNRDELAMKLAAKQQSNASKIGSLQVTSKHNNSKAN